MVKYENPSNRPRRSACVGFAWITREQIARDIISDEFARLDILASYAIRSIGPSEQVLSDVVLGDPEKKLGAG